MSTPEEAGVHRRLEEVLVEAKWLGFLGPGPIERHLVHARGFAQAWAAVQQTGDSPTAPPATVVDLGSGAGVPGLVLADEWPEADVVLVESQQRRAAFLRAAVQRCGFDGRVKIAEERAEDFGRSSYRGTVDCVVARGFGRPAVTAECGAPLLRLGGCLIVSAPPESERLGDRWPALGLSRLGLSPATEIRQQFGYLVMRQVSPCPERFPRRSGIPEKRALFE